MWYNRMRKRGAAMKKSILVCLLVAVLSLAAMLGAAAASEASVRVGSFAFRSVFSENADVYAFEDGTVSVIFREGAPTVLMNKSVFQEVGGFDESMRSLEDWDFALKVAKKYPIGFVPEVLLKVAGSEGGVSSNLGAYYQNRCYMLRKYRADYLVTGMFERTVQDILEKAKRDNLLAQVEKLMMFYLSQ